MLRRAGRMSEMVFEVGRLLERERALEVDRRGRTRSVRGFIAAVGRIARDVTREMGGPVDEVPALRRGEKGIRTDAGEGRVNARATAGDAGGEEVDVIPPHHEVVDHANPPQGERRDRLRHAGRVTGAGPAVV